MKFFCLALVLSSCAYRACGRLDPEEIVAFHHSHGLSVGANESSVEGLAVGDDPPDGGDVGLGWQVCVENGKAQIQNHPTRQDLE